MEQDTFEQRRNHAILLLKGILDEARADMRHAQERVARLEDALIKAETTATVVEQTGSKS